MATPGVHLAHNPCLFSSPRTDARIRRDGAGHGDTSLLSQLLRRLRQEDPKFKACLDCSVSSRPACLVRLCLKLTIKKGERGSSMVGPLLNMQKYGAWVSHSVWEVGGGEGKEMLSDIQGCRWKSVHSSAYETHETKWFRDKRTAHM